jgi:hypothetical protein
MSPIVLVHSCAKRSSPGRLFCTDPVKFPSPGLLIWLSLCGRMHLSCGLVKVQEIRESEVCAKGEGYSKVEGSAEENPGLSKCELPGSIQDALLRFRQSGLKQWMQLFYIFLMVLVLPKTDESRSASIILVTNRQPRGRGTPTQKTTEKKSVARKLVGVVPEGSQSTWPCTASMPLFEPNFIHSLCSCLCWPCTASMPLFEPNFIHSLCSCLCVTLADARVFGGVTGGDPF